MVPGKGRGLVATQPLSPGQLLLVVPPLVLVEGELGDIPGEGGGAERGHVCVSKSEHVSKHQASTADDKHSRGSCLCVFPSGVR